MSHHRWESSSSVSTSPGPQFSDEESNSSSPQATSKTLGKRAKSPSQSSMLLSFPSDVLSLGILLCSWLDHLWCTRVLSSSSFLCLCDIVLRLETHLDLLFSLHFSQTSSIPLPPRKPPGSPAERGNSRQIRA